MERQYVGIDLHRRRSVIVRRTAAGENALDREDRHGGVEPCADLLRLGRLAESWIAPLGLPSW